MKIMYKGSEQVHMSNSLLQSKDYLGDAQMCFLDDFPDVLLTPCGTAN